MNKKKKQLKLTMIRSAAGRLPSHRATLKGLGLSRIRQTVEVEDTDCIRGMINQISYLLRIEEN